MLIKDILNNVIGEYLPNTNTVGFFAGVDTQWIFSVIVLCICLVGIFGIFRALFRR